MKRIVPEFITQYSTSKEEREKLMKQYCIWTQQDISKMMVSHYEKKLDKLIREDEKESPLSWFQWKWGKAKRLGKRETLRQLIKDLKE